jgi:hypothetical protein
VSCLRSQPDRQFPKRIVAIQHIRKMRGGAQSHLMRCSDENFYVVKFCNNPQHKRVLANEMLATRLAEEAWLPVPETALVSVDDWLVRHTPLLNVQLNHKTIDCHPGIHFGSKYVVSPLVGQVFDYLPINMLSRVRNVEAFAGMLAMDKWICNVDIRQAAFWRTRRERRYHVSFIDQGWAFNAGEWTFPDAPMRGVYEHDAVYKDIRGWQSFEPWLSRIERMSADVIWTIGKMIPKEWYGATEDLEALVEALLQRRSRVRDLITCCRRSRKRSFPLWADERSEMGNTAS